jgi:mRNA interferase MazF
LSGANGTPWPGTVPVIERYGVYWVSLDPVQGSEIAKTRAAVVISDDAMNRFLDTVVVCPLTSRLHQRWPSRIQTTIAGSPAEIAIDQIRTIDKARIGTRLDSLAPSAATQVRHVITRMYGVLAEG